MKLINKHYTDIPNRIPVRQSIAPGHVGTQMRPLQTFNIPWSSAQHSMCCLAMYTPTLNILIFGIFILLVDFKNNGFFIKIYCKRLPNLRG